MHNHNWKKISKETKEFVFSLLKSNKNNVSEIELEIQRQNLPSLTKIQISDLKYKFKSCKN
jgi:hypothetical protein